MIQAEVIIFDHTVCKQKYELRNGNNVSHFTENPRFRYFPDEKMVNIGPHSRNIVYIFILNLSFFCKICLYKCSKLIQKLALTKSVNDKVHVCEI